MSDELPLVEAPFRQAASMVARTSRPDAIRLVYSRRHIGIAAIAIVGIAAHLVLRFATNVQEPASAVPLRIVLLVGGVPLVLELLLGLIRCEFGSDLLAGISIVLSVVLEEYLAGALVVLMLSGGAALEAYAVRSASKVLEALARRMPSIAHRQQGGTIVDIDLNQVNVDDRLVIFPHELCPVDGTVIEGRGAMDESYLTGEPYVVSKTTGSLVLSGAINGDGALTIRANKLPIDSRYAKIVEVMKASEQQRPRLRRLGDQLGAVYTPLAIAIAGVAWFVSGDPVRFLAVMVVATPCPLLIAIPVTIIGAISLAARRGIIVKNPAALEAIGTCRTAIFDKTGTLTYGRPQLTETIALPSLEPSWILTLAASVERYSKHPLAPAILEAAVSRSLVLQEASSISEEPGCGLTGAVDGHEVVITGRKGLPALDPDAREHLPPPSHGLECIVVIDGRYAATMRFRDEPREEGPSFIAHLQPRHDFRRVLMVSGDRENEARYLADKVGIRDVYASQTPEQKVEIVRRETKRERTVFLGDGINDAPALTAATVGLAFGQNSDVTAEAADAVILDSSLGKVDEFLHIGQKMRRIALESAVGGIAFSLGGMCLAAAGYLPPVAGAVFQEIIDVVAVVNALRMALPTGPLTDFLPAPASVAPSKGNT